MALVPFNEKSYLVIFIISQYLVVYINYLISTIVNIKLAYEEDSCIFTFKLWIVLFIIWSPIQYYMMNITTVDNSSNFFIKFMKMFTFISYIAFTIYSGFIYYENPIEKCTNNFEDIENYLKHIFIIQTLIYFSACAFVYHFTWKVFVKFELLFYN